MDDTAILISRHVTGNPPKRDENGNVIEVETAREIYVTVESASRTEFFSAGAEGGKPEYCLKTFYLDYQGEREIEYQAKRYEIYRTYTPLGGDRTELYIRGVEGYEKNTA